NSQPLPFVQPGHGLADQRCQFLLLDVLQRLAGRSLEELLNRCGPALVGIATVQRYHGMALSGEQAIATEVPRNGEEPGYEFTANPIALAGPVNAEQHLLG